MNMTEDRINPLITVVVPIYNDEKFLSKCIKSIANQYYKHLEIILLDDGSKDNSGNICDAFAKKDNRVKVIHKNNTGVSNTRNVGIKNAKGKYICFVDADDIVSKDYVSYLYSLLKKDKNADIALTTQMFGNFDHKQVKKEIIRQINNETAVIQILSYNIPIGVYCKLFKTQFLHDNLIRFNEHIYIGEGFNFNIDAFQRANKIISSNKKIYYYRRNNSTSATTKFSIDKCLNGIEAIYLIRKHFILHTEKIERAWNYAYWRTCSDAFDMIVLANAQKQYTQEYMKIKKVVKSKDAFSVWQCPTSAKDRARAMVMFIEPNFIPWAMKRRNRKYNIDIKT